MKARLIFILALNLVFSSYSNAQLPKPKGGVKNKGLHFTVSGKITVTQSYCGGAAPTEEMMAEMEKPKPYNGKIFYVRKGNTNDLKNEIVFTFTANANGEFSFDLPPGTYSIIQKEQVHAFKMSDYHLDTFRVADEKCLKSWWAKSYYVFEIKSKNIAGLEFKFHKQCFIDGDVPCISYTGPMPP